VKKPTLRRASEWVAVAAGGPLAGLQKGDGIRQPKGAGNSLAAVLGRCRRRASYPNIGGTLSVFFFVCKLSQTLGFANLILIYLKFFAVYYDSCHFEHSLKLGPKPRLI